MKVGFFDLFRGADINAKVAEARENDDAVLLDVRGRDEFQAGHIEGAVCIPLPEIGKAVRLYGTKRLYVYCASGARSRQAVAQLRAAGVESAENIGGISSWRGPIARS